MNDISVKRLALVYAKQAEIEGMKVENKKAERTGEIFPYSDQHFNEKSIELQEIAYKNDYEF